MSQEAPPIDDHTGHTGQQPDPAHLADGCTTGRTTGHTTAQRSASTLRIPDLRFRQSSESDIVYEVDQLVNTWNSQDVEKWVQSRNLQRFTDLVKKHNLTGRDLADLNLSFVYDDSILPIEREEFLSEVYQLISPDIRPPGGRRPTRYNSAEEQEKYTAAVRVARRRDRSSSPSLVIFSRSSSPGSTLSLPVTKTRSRSESGVDRFLSEATSTASPARKYLKRKSTHNVLLANKNVARRPSLYSVFHSSGSQCVLAVIVRRGEDGYNFTCDSTPSGLVVVKDVLGLSPLQVGDMILEVNEISLIRGDNSSTDLLLDRLKKSESLQVVLSRQLREHSQNHHGDCTDLTHDLNVKLKSAEKKWQKLQDLLVNLKSESIDVNQLMEETSPTRIQEVKDDIALQVEEENVQLKEALSGHTEKVNNLERTLEEKAGALLEMERQRNMALNSVEELMLTKSMSTVSSDSSLSAGMYAELLESLEQDTISKDDVLHALRETIQEASTQKLYLDRLMCAVVDEAPWLLDVLATDVTDHSVHTHDNKEEFC